jgi:hypothetical protein
MPSNLSGARISMILIFLTVTLNSNRTHLKKASKGSRRCCGSAKNAHIPTGMLRFFPDPRHALNPDPHF